MASVWRRVLDAIAPDPDPLTDVRLFSELGLLCTIMMAIRVERWAAVANRTFDLRRIHGFHEASVVLGIPMCFYSHRTLGDWMIYVAIPWLIKVAGGLQTPPA